MQKVERKIGKQRTELAPGDPLVPPDENRPVQLDVTVRNLLDNEDTENLILEPLKNYVAKQLGLETPNFRFEKPHLNDAEVRFTLIGCGRGEETEMALSNAVETTDDGILGFGLDLDAIRRCEQLHGYIGGLALGNTSILPSGPIKVRFERLELTAQLRYMQTALSDLRKRVGSVRRSIHMVRPPMWWFRFLPAVQRRRTTRFVG